MFSLLLQCTVYVLAVVGLFALVLQAVRAIDQHRFRRGQRRHLFH